MLNFEGYYIRDLDADRKGDFYYVLRFFKDKTVISSTIHSDSDIRTLINSIKKWLNEDFKNSVGKYDIYDKNKISFKITSHSGYVEYFGVIDNEKQITLNSISHINGHTANDMRYIYYPINEDNSKENELISEIWKESH